MLPQVHRSLGHRLISFLVLAAVALALPGGAYAQQTSAEPRPASPRQGTRAPPSRRSSSTIT
jgi:hypothetical protein